ncbi:DEAD/DEAH box helicase [Flavobacterium sp.]|uniref:DEAD/DEAH box helicase n=1 Tax=Flavobacterium sp. TaxID=239 RepID=UPI003D13E334
MSISLAIDFSWNADEDRWIPSLYLVDITKPPLYVFKIANEETVKSVGKTINHDEEKIWNLVYDLKTETILKKLTKNKKNTSLALLKEDKTVKNILQEYLNRKGNELLELTQKLELPLSIDLRGKKEFYHHQVTFSEIVLKPQLHFSKHEVGIDYTLTLLDNETKIVPSKEELTIINQFPCWAIWNKQLVTISDIDGLKLKPFLKNETVHIPKRIEETYFKTFINDIIKKADVTTDGFEIISKNNIVNFSLKGSHDFFNTQYVLQLVFDYEGYCFETTQKKNQHSFISFDENNTVSVIQHKRNLEQEEEIANQLIAFGFEKNKEGNFTLANATGTMACIEFVIDNHEALTEAGFDLTTFHIDQKKIQLKKSTLALQSDEQSDWFDLKMTIRCGAHHFPFSEIISHIKNGNPWYLLPDDTYFIIPKIWMKTYGTLAQFGTKRNDGSIALPKSHFQNLNLENVALENEAPIKQTLTYEPSSSLKATLRPYQQQGVQWLLNHYANGLGACLADDMGLGKTLQTLALLIAVQEDLKAEAPASIATFDLFSSTEAQSEPLKVLIVAPSSLVFNWYSEAKKFAPHFSCLKYVGNDRKLVSKKLTRYDLVFTSFSVLSRDIALLEKQHFRYLIVDESQQIKNRNSKIFKAINQLQVDNKISLSGTPIENSLADLWSQMQFINPSILGEYAFFEHYFKKPIEKHKDETKIEELKNIINPYILRRTKTEVLKDLPEVIEQVVLCEMSEEQEKNYEEEKSKARNYLLKLDENTSAIHVLNVLMKLRQWSNHPKLIEPHSAMDSGKFEHVTAYLETLAKSKSKTLVFSSFVSHLELYENWCATNNIRYCSLTGSTASGARENAVKQFQEDESTLFFFISLKAGGVGLNLTKASYIVILDPWWNPFAEKQAIARAHRIGQENKVNVVRFITQNTIEEKILKLQENKKELSESIIDESSIPEAIRDNLDYLLQ